MADVATLQAEVARLWRRDAAAQTLTGLLRYHLSKYDEEAAGCDFRPYRVWKELDPLTEVISEYRG